MTETPDTASANPQARPQALLVLEDGRVFRGRGVGASGEGTAEVVFNTSMTGYQEILTDPSYCGQLVVMTTPHIGNYGVNREDEESARPHAAGLAMRQICWVPSNQRAEESLPGYLERHGLFGIDDLDTRALVRHLRTRGSLMGIFSTLELDSDRLLARLRGVPGMAGRDLVPSVTCQDAYAYTGPVPGPGPADTPAGPPIQVTVIDCGVKRKILGWLRHFGCDVKVVPATTTAEAILAGGPDGVLVSNGPGDPSAVTYVVETIRALLGRVPIFGVCLGHQLLALALGAKTYKLRFGHRGGNQPVKDLRTGRVSVSAHNHGFAVDMSSLAERAVEEWFVNLNDGCNEGLRCLDVDAASVQFHPEAAPGPNDTNYLFSDWVEHLIEVRSLKGSARA